MTVWAGVGIGRGGSIEPVIDIGMTMRTAFLKPLVMNRTPTEQQALMQGRMKTIDETDRAVPQRAAKNRARKCLVLDWHKGTHHAFRRNSEIGRSCVHIKHGDKAQIQIRVGIDEIGTTEREQQYVQRKAIEPLEFVQDRPGRLTIARPARSCAILWR